MYCWPEGFIPWFINLQPFSHNLIKWLPGECAHWFFDDIMTWSYCLYRRWSTSRQKNSILINEHALKHEHVPFMMSVFCSDTLIFALECWKCILRCPDFKIFPETRAFSASFFLLHQLQSFCHLHNIFLKTLLASYQRRPQWRLSTKWTPVSDRHPELVPSPRYRLSKRWTSFQDRHLKLASSLLQLSIEAETTQRIKQTLNTAYALSIWNARRHSNEFLRAPSQCFVGK